MSGINEGQNGGPLAYVSGTVGAGRAAVRRGIPAIAGSAGLGEDADYELAAELIVGYIEEHRAEYAGRAPPAVDAVMNINVPDCTAGTAKDARRGRRSPRRSPTGVNPFASDCSVAEPAERRPTTSSPSRPGTPP